MLKPELSSQQLLPADWCVQWLASHKDHAAVTFKMIAQGHGSKSPFSFVTSVLFCLHLAVQLSGSTRVIAICQNCAKR